MEWVYVVALVVTIPVLLLPAAFVWYLNLGGIYATVMETRRKRPAERRLAIEKTQA